MCNSALLSLALIHAVKTNQNESVATLAARIKNINYQNMTRYTALHSAVEHNNTIAADILIKYGADLMLVPDWTPGFDAYTNGLTHPRLPSHGPVTVECALLMAFEMRETHQEMQLLLTRAIYAKLPDITCKYGMVQMDKIRLLGHYAMLYSTPRVFFEVVRYNGDANQLDATNMTPLMCVLRNMSVAAGRCDMHKPLYTDWSPHPSHAQCVRTMKNVAEILEKHPEMLWARFKRAEPGGFNHDWALRSFGEDNMKPMPALGMSLWGAKQLSSPGRLYSKDGSTALGMLVFDTIPYRNFAHMVDKCTTFFPYCERQQRKHREKIDRQAAILGFFKHDVIPALWKKMLTQMRIALGMASHERLGSNTNCLVGVLGVDLMNEIFNTLLRTVAVPDQKNLDEFRNERFQTPGDMHRMLC